MAQALLFPLHQGLKNKDTQILNFPVIRFSNFSNSDNTLNCTYFLTNHQLQLPETKSPDSVLNIFCSIEIFLFWHITQHKISAFCIFCSTTHFINQ